MGQISLSVPISGQPNSTEDPKVASDLTIIQNVINGGLDAGNLTTGLALLLKIAGTTRNITFGSFASGTGFGGGSGPKSDVIPHGLGVTPVTALVVAAVIVTTGGTFPVLVSVGVLDATNINVISTIPTGGTSSVGPVFYWAAIG